MAKRTNGIHCGGPLAGKPTGDAHDRIWAPEWLRYLRGAAWNR